MHTHAHTLNQSRLTIISLCRMCVALAFNIISTALFLLCVKLVMLREENLKTTV